MKYRMLATLAAICAVVVSPFLFTVLAAGTPRYIWPWLPALFVLLPVIAICVILPLYSWREKLFAGMIPILAMALSAFTNPGFLIAGAFVALLILQPVFTAIGRPPWNYPLESFLCGLLLALLALWVLAVPAFILYLRLFGLWRPGMLSPIFHESSLLVVALALAVSILILLRKLSAPDRVPPNNPLKCAPALRASTGRSKAAPLS